MQSVRRGRPFVTVRPFVPVWAVYRRGHGRASHVELAQVLGDLAIEMQSQSDTESTLRTISEGAVAIVPGTRWAGISLIKQRVVEPRAPSDEVASELDKLQSFLGEGPCLESLREHHTILIDDMASDSRWPRFAREAIERGARSLLSFQLFVRHENLGALNLYGDQARAFDEDSVFIGEVLAQHASVALVGAGAVSQFHAALASRDVIGQAKGILMYRENLNDMQAFQLLLKTSQRGNIKLVDIARWVVEQHLSTLIRT